MDKQIAKNEGAMVELLNQEMKELQEIQKQIEEMEETLYDYCLHYDDCVEGSERNIAKFLINAGYRKIDENTVVLTKAEYEKLKDEKADNILADVDKVFKAEFAYMKNRVIRRINKDYAKKVRKETVKELLQELLDFVDFETFRKGYELVKVKRKLKEMAKNRGVEAMLKV